MDELFVLDVLDAFGENIRVIGSSRDSSIVAPKIRAVITRSTWSNIFDT